MFGSTQLRDIPFNLAEKPPLPLESATVHVLDNLQLADDGVVSIKGKGSLVGNVTGPVLNVLWQVSRELGISVQLRCIISQSRHKEKSGSLDLCACLSSIIYGPFRLFDHIGDLLEDNELFLQDPRGCDRNVRYRNPHRLSGKDSNAPMTIDREPDSRTAGSPGCDVSLDGLDDPGFHESLAMAEKPEAIETDLLKHQRQALYFMIDRESGWDRTRHICGVWKARLVNGLRVYLNTISNDVQMEQPPATRGGLLADEMGLGKSLSVISLVASDSDSLRQSLHHGTSFWDKRSSTRLQCTLIIVPPTLIETWEDQLQRHCRPGLLRWAKHHGKNRLSQIAQLESLNIVLTTYQMVVSEWKKNRASSPLFSTHWFRIVLDEAHQIRDKHTQTAKAICALEADRRWAVTGTPIQNHLTDLETLLQFLRVHPYDHPEMLKEQVVDLWKREPDIAVKRLQKLLSCIALRRTSSTIKLPGREDKVFELQFSPQERQWNEHLEAQLRSIQCQSKFEDDSQPGLLNHAFQVMHAMRSVCNFGVLPETRPSDFEQTATRPWDITEAQVAFEYVVTAGEASCAKCAQDVNFSDSATGLLQSEEPKSGRNELMISRCAKVLCGHCSFNLQGPNMLSETWCGHEPQCVALPISAFQDSTHSSSFPGAPVVGPRKFPAKIEALIKDLNSFPSSKSVVFSAWRTTLDLAEAALTMAKIPFVRFDGKVAEKDRSTRLAQFSNDAAVRVILFTISCGAVGLDLTAADRAYLMEPQWNPTVEDQALARVYRMGQQKPVTTVRFVIAGSYEQRIMEVQKRKTIFAGILLSPRNRTPIGKGSRKFEYLRSLLQ